MRQAAGFTHQTTFVFTRSHLDGNEACGGDGGDGGNGVTLAAQVAPAGMRSVAPLQVDDSTFNYSTINCNSADGGDGGDGGNTTSTPAARPAWAAVRSAGPSLAGTLSLSRLRPLQQLC